MEQQSTFQIFTKTTAEYSDGIKKIYNLSEKLSYSEELEILEQLFKKYGLMTISDYSKKTGQSRQAIYDQLKKEKLPNIELSNKTFIISEL